MILWRDPQYFWLLPLVLAAAGGLFVLLRRRAAALAAFAEAALAARLTPDLDRRRWRWRMLLRVAAMLLLVVALAGPKWGFQWQQMKRQGLDLIVALDTSRSMLATDVKPNRLERAKLAILDLVPLLEGDRIGLVPFAGTAFLECPLTMDYAAFERSVRAVEVGIIPRGGTSLAAAIDTSLDAFEAREGKYEALILITDGESLEGDVAAAAERAKARGVRIFTVGIGTPEGELLPLGADGFVKDRDGQVVKSRLDEATLQEIAVTTGGAYVQGIGPTLGLDQVFRDHIAPMERREVASALQRHYEERFQIPLGLAIVLLLIELLVPLRGPASAGRRGAWRQRRRTAAVALCLPFLFGFLDPPGDRAAEGNQLYAAGKYDEAASKYGEGLIDAPASPMLQFNLATALYKQGKYDDALQALAKVEASGERWVGAAAYNAGNARYQIGAATEESDPQKTIASWEQALADYKRAMVADPADVDAKFNHELVARKLAELRKKLEEQQKQEQDQEQQEQDQEQQDQEQQDQQDQQQQEQDQQGADQQKPEEQPGEPQPEQAQDQGEPQPEEQQPPQQQPQPEPGGGEQPAQPQQAEAGAAGEGGEPGEEQRAAQAVIDTARGEELSPLDIERPAGVAGDAEPSRDW